MKNLIGMMTVVVMIVLLVIDGDGDYSVDEGDGDGYVQYADDSLNKELEEKTCGRRTS